MKVYDTDSHNSTIRFGDLNQDFIQGDTLRNLYLPFKGEWTLMLFNSTFGSNAFFNAGNQGSSYMNVSINPSIPIFIMPYSDF